MATVPEPVVFAVTEPSDHARRSLHDAEAEAHARHQTLVVCPVRSATGWRPAEIAARAKAADARLIVLCDPSRGRLAGWLCARLIRHAHCAVLVARPPHGDSVLIAIDLEDPSLDALSIAAREASYLASPVTALHCHGADLDGTTQRLSDLVRRYQHDAELAVIAGAPADTIVNAAAGLGADLVVIATHGRTGLRRWSHRSVAEAVVRRAPCSVLVVRHERTSPLAQPMLG